VALAVASTPERDDDRSDRRFEWLAGAALAIVLALLVVWIVLRLV
jgi:hypothetical protein